MIADTAACLLDHVTAWWLSTGRPAPADPRVVLGAPAYDSCCPDGLLIVSVDQLVWFDPFPAEQLGQLPGIGAGVAVVPLPCRGTLGAFATIHVGLCVPVLDNQGHPPESDAETAANLNVLDLAEVIASGLNCTRFAEDCWSVGTVVFTGAEGGCTVALITVRIAGSCDCPAAAAPAPPVIP